MPKILTVIGTRPEIIKTSKLIPLLDDQFDHLFIFTSQHYSTNMVDIFFDELNVRKPDLFLGAKSSEYESMVKPIQCAIRDIDPDYVIVYGDTNSTYASAIATTNLSKKLIHIEAGCRSFDKKMPEEVNRIQTDHMSHYLFTPTELTRSYLMREGITNNVFIVGNTSVDACLEYSKIAEKKK
jgi:UDP-N-acetylglucosamine 2-epimerase